jgi:hypothetical protein
MDFNEKVYTGIGILLFLILLGYFLAYNFFGIRTSITQGFNKLKEIKENVGEKVNTFECPKEIIPEKVRVLDGNFIPNRLENRKKIKDNWVDGTSIIVWRDPNDMWSGFNEILGQDCFKGSQEGENVNHYYCKNLMYKKVETPINEGGVIGKTEITEYRIDLEIMPLGKVNENEKTLYIKSEELYEIYDGEFYIKKAEGMGITSYDIFMNYSVVSSKCVRQQ